MINCIQDARPRLPANLAIRLTLSFKNAKSHGHSHALRDNLTPTISQHRRVRAQLATFFLVGVLALGICSVAEAKSPDQYRAQIATLKAQRAAFKAERDKLVIERDRLKGERDAALAGLPDAIRAVPVDQFAALVFTPARQAWPCDDSYQGQSFSSITFYSTSFCRP